MIACLLVAMVFGLIGMSERVALYGGILETGPVFPGGYRVHASFPLEPGPRGSLATCCDEGSALSEVAATAERARRAEQGPSKRATEPEPLVKPRVVPPLIGRVIPPHRRPRPSQRQTEPGGEMSPTKTRRSEP